MKGSSGLAGQGTAALLSLKVLLRMSSTRKELVGFERLKTE